jgi:hypothetical protein
VYGRIGDAFGAYRFRAYRQGYLGNIIWANRKILAPVTPRQGNSTGCSPSGGDLGNLIISRIAMFQKGEPKIWTFAVLGAAAGAKAQNKKQGK